jgi:hypothetical protein
VRRWNQWPEPDVYELFGQILRGTPKLDGALCRGRSQLFDSDDPLDVDDATAICHQCPALQACAEWAATQRHDKLSGVIAGELREWCQHPSDLIRRKKARSA